MCIAVPMEIVHIYKDGKALVRQDNLETDIDVSLIENPKPGDYVIVHAGFAIEALDLEEAKERLELFKAMSESPGTAIC